MKCQLCDSEILLPKIVCPACSEEQNLTNNKILDYLIQQYKEYKSIIKQYEKDEYYDTYRTKAVKNTKLEVYREVLIMLEIAIESHSNIKVSEIEESEEFHVSTPRMCDLNPRKICNHCGDC